MQVLERNGSYATATLRPLELHLDVTSFSSRLRQPLCRQWYYSYNSIDYPLLRKGSFTLYNIIPIYIDFTSHHSRADLKQYHTNIPPYTVEFWTQGNICKLSSKENSN